MNLSDLLHPEEYCPDTSVLSDIAAEEAFWSHTPDQGDVDKGYSSEYYHPGDEDDLDPLPF